MPYQPNHPHGNNFETNDDPDAQKTQQLKNTMGGMANFAAALARDRSGESSPHSRNALPKPLRTNFGEFTVKYTYVDQVNPDDQLTPTAALVDPVGVVVATLETQDGKKRIVQIGKRDATEEVLDAFPQKYHDATPDGDHVVYIEDEEGVIPIVLAADELPALIKPGEGLTFGKEGKRTIAGTVTNVVAYK